MLEHITDHAAQAQARVIQKLKDKPKLAAFLATINRQHQEIEDAFWQLYSQRSIDTAVGDPLDILGKIVGERRDGSLDADYRLRIRARIRANLSNGTVEDIFRVFRALLGSSAALATFTWVDAWPARFVFTIGAVAIPTPQVPIFVRFLYDSKAGGVGAHFGSQPVPDADAFTCAISSFLTLSAMMGDTTITVDSTADVRIPAAGTLIIDAGTPDEEVVPYSAKTATTYTVAALTVNHAIGAACSIDPSPGKGWGDDMNPATGGALVSVIDVDL